MKLVKKISLLGLLMTVITIDVHAINKAFPKKFGISCGIATAATLTFMSPGTIAKKATDPTFVGSTLLATAASSVFSHLLLETLLNGLRKKMDEIRSERFVNDVIKVADPNFNEERSLPKPTEIGAAFACVAALTSLPLLVSTAHQTSIATASIASALSAVLVGGSSALFYSKSNDLQKKIGVKKANALGTVSTIALGLAPFYLPSNQNMTTTSKSLATAFFAFWGTALTSMSLCNAINKSPKAISTKGK